MYKDVGEVDTSVSDDSVEELLERDPKNLRDWVAFGFPVLPEPEKYGYGRLRPQ